MYTASKEVAQLVANKPIDIKAMPAEHTRRGPQRSANMPPPAPSTK